MVAGSVRTFGSARRSRIFAGCFTSTSARKAHVPGRGKGDPEGLIHHIFAREDCLEIPVTESYLRDLAWQPDRSVHADL